MAYMCDFETTTDPEDCRVWAWGVCDIDNPENFEYGNSIKEFLKWLRKHTGVKLYFHNLKFDGEFIIHNLFKEGFHHNPDKTKLEPNQFSTLISDKGNFYTMDICYKKYGRKRVGNTIIDSLKILPFSVEQIAKTFGLPMSKGEIDYSKYREPGYMLTEDEVDYLRRDVQIPAKALKLLFNQGLQEITQGSNALHDYKKILGDKLFNYRFPTT